VLFSALKEGRELPPQKEKERTIKKMMTIIKKSSRMLERPTQTKEETKTFITMVEINGQEAVALLDLGCHHKCNIYRNGTNSGPEGPPINRMDTHTIGYQRE